MATVQGKPTALRCFGRDLSALAQAGQYAPLEGCEPWVGRVLQILLPRANYKYNPVLIGRSEAMGWPIVAEVVRRIARGEVPAGLRVRQVVALDWEALVRDLPGAGEPESWAAPEHRWYTPEELAALAARCEREAARCEREAARWERRRQRQWERLLRRVLHDDRAEGRRADPIVPPADPIYDPIHQRLEAVFAAARRSEGRVLLYVEQLQCLVGTELEPYPVDMHDLLKPALGSGELRILGACSLDAYRQYIEKDAAMQRRFCEVPSPELSRSLGRDGV